MERQLAPLHRIQKPGLDKYTNCNDPTPYEKVMAEIRKRHKLRGNQKRLGAFSQMKSKRNKKYAKRYVMLRLSY